ncbi:hypothetical protein BHM03_00002882 [Ensete ventricosum]|uniref:Uncharacterized protein n=1 Tax=Ensete ventricosum TaxID=4639 RepID=A0A445M9V6_ENSVE|nr:hypothetical protein BHM03_00002882 [Ensete ventricosum]
MSARGTRSAADLVSEVEVTDRATSDRIKCLIGYPMGRSDSSKPTLDGQPQQHFGGSHVSPTDQVGSRSGIRGGGDQVRHCLASPINIAWHAMPSPHVATAARLPYISAISRGTTKDRHPRDGPRDQPTDAQDEDHQGSVNPRRKSRSPPTLTDLRTRT